ncbi:uncharacterized protein MELLADRAFT_101976 [Melampsora larici-populina 98AG31]|uniref:Uncharacterized protein n=1 Tax=Melampsora larici-populina (strain 98AG31 / pathotype 3-4-7) TaxID=747676 RepID=F4R5J9_MELLP|nr:uncharacterized protein MELLADRAFT_101976 [Melampsora larici-populina 98AG31]EGG12060.1 hypothetical protein MELLADRAFT_101976 [Melampsora larici-populina 98AG31]
MRCTPPVTRNRGSQQGSPSQRGSPSIRGSSSRGSRGRVNTRPGAESAPPGIPTNQQGERSPTLSVGNQNNPVGNLHNQSPPFADNDQTMRQDPENLFSSTPVDHRQPPPHPHLTRTLHPQPTMAKLDSDGTNFHTWLEEANANIYFLIGKADYLNTPSNPSNLLHPDIDHAENTIAYRVVYYSVTTDLRTVIRREQQSFLAHDAYLILSNQFNKAGRSSQLATWQSMMSSQMDIFKTSLSQHLESLDRLADALDRDGFVWTRDSVMSLVYQASMPDKPELNFDAANATLDLRWSYDKRPYSSTEIRAALQTTLLNLKLRFSLTSESSIEPCASEEGLMLSLQPARSRLGGGKVWLLTVMSVACMVTISSRRVT